MARILKKEGTIWTLMTFALVFGLCCSRVWGLDEDALIEDEELDGIDDKDMSGFPGGKMPTPEELLAALDTMEGISDDEKNELRMKIHDYIRKQKAAGGGGGGVVDDDEDMANNEENVRHVVGSPFFTQFFTLIGMLSIVTLIFVFFGYKLYKSLSEREKKREEKKKNKQMKKKK